MSTQIKTRRGTAAEHTTFTGAEGELTVNTTNDSVHVHDGSTAGGHELAKADGSNLAMESDLTFGDNDKAIFGAGSDLQIFHDGGNSVIKDGGLGDLYIQGEGLIRLTNNGATEHYAKFNQNGAVQLYYDNAQKFSTTSTGIDVTGTATMDGLTSSQAAEIFSNGFSGGETPALRLTNTSEGVGTTSTLELIAGSTVSANNTRKAVIENSSTTSSGSTLNFYTTSDGTNLYKRLQAHNNGDISFYEDTGTTAKFFWDASAESLGIGTSSPIGKLDVSDGTNPLSIDSSTYNEIQSYNRPLLLNRQGNNVGIGTSSPNYPLEVGHSGNTDFAIVTNDDSNVASETGIYMRSTTKGTLSVGSGADMVFKEGTSEHMRIDSSGNLLVGKSSTDNNESAGLTLINDGGLFVARDGAGSRFNRLSSDGEIIRFQKDGSTVGSIGTYGGDMAFITGSIGLRLYDAGGSIIPTNGSGISNNDAVDLGEPNIRFKDLYLSGGVYLGGTGSANYLDDYEEGTWTPVVGSIGGGSTSTGTFVGRYTKVGNLVTVEWQCLNYTFSGGSGDLVITGLPFTPNEYNNRSTRNGNVTMYKQDVNSSAMQVVPEVNSAGELKFREWLDNTYWTVTAIENSGGVYIEGSMTYWTAA